MCDLTLFSAHPGYTGLHRIADRRDCSPRRDRCPVCALESVNLWLRTITRSMSDFNRREVRGFPVLDPEFWVKWFYDTKVLVSRGWTTPLVSPEPAVRRWAFMVSGNRWMNWSLPVTLIEPPPLIAHNQFNQIRLLFIEHADGRRETGYPALDLNRISMMIFRALAPVEAEGVTGVFYKRMTPDDVIESEKDAGHMRKPNTVSRDVWVCCIGHCNCNHWASGRNGVQPPATWACTYPHSQDAMQEHRQVYRDADTLGDTQCSVLLVNTEECEFMLNAAIGDADNAEVETPISSKCLERKTWEPPRPHAVRTFPVRLPDFKGWTFVNPKRVLVTPPRRPAWMFRETDRHKWFRKNRRLWERKWHEAVAEVLDGPKGKQWKQNFKLELVTFKNPATGKRELAVELPGVGNPAQVAVLHKCYRELQRKAVANKHLIATLARNSNGHLTQASRKYILCDWDGVDTTTRLETWRTDGKGVNAKQWLKRRIRKGVDKKPSTPKSGKSVLPSTHAVASHFANSAKSTPIGEGNA